MALTDKLTAIADAIRARTGKSAELSLDDMVTEIENLSSTGNFVEGNFSYDRGFTYESSPNYVKRQGDAVILSLTLGGLSITGSNIKIATLYDGVVTSNTWRPKEDIRFDAIYSYAGVGGTTYGHGYVTLKRDGSLYSWSYESDKVIDYIRVDGGFEAEPLT